MSRKANTCEGFTLVELMIVVVIIGILAAVAIPNFTTVVTKAKLSELKSGLWNIVHLEQAYYHARESYVEFAYGENSVALGYNQPASKSHFTFSFVNSDTSAWGKEKDAANDVNSDDDGDDGMTVSVTGRQGIISGSAGDNFAW
jgi:prepilin-type N-terminal cleavage/methylation domain-containing protein